MSPCSSPVIQLQYWASSGRLTPSWVIERVHRALRGQRAEDRAARVAGQHLPGEEDDDAEQPESDQGQPEAPQDVRRHDSPWDDCGRHRARHRMDAA